MNRQLRFFIGAAVLWALCAPGLALGYALFGAGPFWFWTVAVFFSGLALGVKTAHEDEVAA